MTQFEKLIKSIKENTGEQIFMNNLDWGKTTEERNNNLDLYHSLIQLKEFDTVELLVNLNDTLKKGAKGTIVFDYESSGMFEVEFFDEKHNTIGVERVFKKDLKIV